MYSTAPSMIYSQQEDTVYRIIARERLTPDHQQTIQMQWIFKLTTDLSTDWTVLQSQRHSTVSAWYNIQLINSAFLLKFQDCLKIETMLYCSFGLFVSALLEKCQRYRTWAILQCKVGHYVYNCWTFCLRQHGLCILNQTWKLVSESFALCASICKHCKFQMDCETYIPQECLLSPSTLVPIYVQVLQLSTYQPNSLLCGIPVPTAFTILLFSFFKSVLVQERAKVCLPFRFLRLPYVCTASLKRRLWR